MFKSQILFILRSMWSLLNGLQVLWKKVQPIGAKNGCQVISKLAAKMAASSELRPRMQKWAKIIQGVTPLVGSLLTPQSYFCPHRLVCPGAHSCSPQFLESQLSGVDSSDAKMPKDEHSSDPGCGVTFDRASWQPFYAPIGGTFFHSTWIMWCENDKMMESNQHFSDLAAHCKMLGRCRVSPSATLSFSLSFSVNLLTPSISNVHATPHLLPIHSKGDAAADWQIPFHILP